MRTSDDMGASSLRHRKIRSSGLILALFLSASLLFGQTKAPLTEAPPSETPQAKNPRNFRALSLGMNLEDLKKALTADEIFSFRGDRDVSLLPSSDQTLIETTGYSFIRRAFFQLRNDSLFMMAFSLDSDKIDHYSIFTAFISDYGEPAELNPQQAVWLFPDTRLAIERPLTVKYIDRAVLDTMSQESKVKESRDAVLRKEFLDGF